MWRMWAIRKVRKRARGGTPLMRGAHNISQSSNKWHGMRGGVRYKRGAPHVKGIGAWGPCNGEVEV